MTIRLHPDWPAIARHALSFRFAVLAAIGAAVETGVEVAISGLSLSALGIFAVAILAGAGAFTRLIAQQRLTTSVNLPPPGEADGP